MKNKILLVVGALLAIALLLYFFMAKSCLKNEEQLLGKYVFLDQYEIVHTNQNCEELDRKNYSVTIKDTINFQFDSHERVCAKCVTQTQYEQLKKISDYNFNRKCVYNFLPYHLRHDEWMNYEEFVEDLRNKETREWVYYFCQENGYNVGRSVGDFSRRLGF